MDSYRRHFSTFFCTLGFYTSNERRKALSEGAREERERGGKKTKNIHYFS